MLINVKMPTLVGILIFISMIDTAFDSLKQSDMLFQKQSNLCADCLGLFGRRLENIYRLVFNKTNNRVIYSQNVDINQVKRVCVGLVTFYKT